ncbi:albusnodin family lasso peptide [Streptomyces olivaceus]|nr:albusnodin family lasso peptide [Streptomyces olivaceus]MBZ6173362.1 albusnodin family lasso peptide [Streptomyces olivaceus]MBZ6179723.1 albusnodin family lasso peptide [Streptomyces olivaceus]
MTPQEHLTADADKDTDALAVPTVIVLGDAASLTRGSDQDSTESKQSPYD